LEIKIQATAAQQGDAPGGAAAPQVIAKPLGG